MPYTPPFTLIPKIISAVPEISDELSLVRLAALQNLPELRRLNRIKTIAGTLAIEGNTLSFEQVVTIADSKIDPVTAQVTDQVKRLLAVMDSEPLSSSELMKLLGLRHKQTFRKNYLESALNNGLIKMTNPTTPNSPTQKYIKIK